MRRPSVGARIARWVFGLLGTALTALIVSMLVPYLQENLWNAWLPGLADFMNTWAAYPVPAWSIAAAVAVTLVLVWLSRRLGRTARRAEGLATYTTDSFGPWHFHWRWSRDRFGRVMIRNLTPICSVHDLALKTNGKALVCPKCRREFQLLDRHTIDQFRQTIAKKAMTRFGVEM